MVMTDSENKDLKFRNPERLLLIVVAFVVWSIGFLDLLGHTSAEPDVWGRYSWPFFVFIIVYGCTIFLWIALFVSSRLLSQIINGVRRVQRRNWLAIGLIVGIGVALWVVLEWDRWSRLPGLQFSAFCLLLLAGGVLLFFEWRERNAGQWWRKVVAYPLFVLLGVELLVQIAAWFGVLPGAQHIGGDFAPYERVYFNTDGFRNDFANRYGWYFPDFRFDNKKKRILILGGRDVQGLSIPSEQQLATLLSDRIDQQRQPADAQTEVFSIGLSGFGPSPYLYDEFLAEIAKFDIDEIIVLFHLGDDFQHPATEMNPIEYTIDDAGGVDIAPASKRLRHDLTHYFLRGFLSFQPVETIRSNYLTVRAISALVHDWIGGANAAADGLPVDGTINFPRLRGFVTRTLALTEPGHAGIRTTDRVSIPNGNNFLFEKQMSDDARKSTAIASSILATAHGIAADHGIVMRVVTIPTFPQAFFSQFEGADWQADIGDFDLFLPEKELASDAASAGFDLVPMGRMMDEEGLGVSEIEKLYTVDGQGQLTPAGHRYFADAIYACFYAKSTDRPCLNE